MLQSFFYNYMYISLKNVFHPQVDFLLNNLSLIKYHNFYCLSYFMLNVIFLFCQRKVYCLSLHQTEQLMNVMNLLLLCFRHIPEALNDFKPDIIAYNAGMFIYCPVVWLSWLTGIVWNKNLMRMTLHAIWNDNKLLFFSLGTDILIGDPLGNLAITPQVCLI